MLQLAQAKTLRLKACSGAHGPSWLPVLPENDGKSGLKSNGRQRQGSLSCHQSQTGERRGTDSKSSRHHRRGHSGRIGGQTRVLKLGDVIESRDPDHPGEVPCRAAACRRSAAGHGPRTKRAPGRQPDSDQATPRRRRRRLAATCRHIGMLQQGGICRLNCRLLPPVLLSSIKRIC